MISLINFPQNNRFAVKLRFMSKTQPEIVEIAHDPKNDPPRKWVFHWRGDAAIPVHCEVTFYCDEGNLTLDVIFEPYPIIILANTTGLIITTSGQ